MATYEEEVMAAREENGLVTTEIQRLEIKVKSLTLELTQARAERDAAREAPAELVEAAKPFDTHDIYFEEHENDPDDMIMHAVSYRLGAYRRIHEIITAAAALIRQKGESK